MNLFKVYALATLTLLGACDLNVNANLDNGGQGSEDSSEGYMSGKCALASIVGEFEGGIVFRPDCVLEVPGDKLTLRIEDYQNDFSAAQTVFGEWFSDQETEMCRIQEVDNELLINCGEFDYRGFRIE